MKKMGNMYNHTSPGLKTGLNFSSSLPANSLPLAKKGAIGKTKPPFITYFRKRVSFSAFSIFVFLLMHVNVSFGQILIPNTTPVTQNFDGMGPTFILPTNWRVQGTATPNYVGGAAVVTQQASSGTPTAGGTYNWGAGAADRAIGAMTSGSFASPNSFMAFFRNTNASNLTGLTIAYDLKRFRINTAAASVQFFYSTDGSTWTAVAAGDIAAASLPTGISAYSFAPPTGVPSATNTGVINKTGISITGLNIASNGNFFLRWNLNTTGANSQGIGIDNVIVQAAFAPVLPSCIGSPISPTDGQTNIATAGTTLTWPAAANATGYDVYFGTSNPATTLVSSNQPGLTYATGALSGAATYYWKVVPRNASGAATGTCSTWSFVTECPSVPSPTGLSNQSVCGNGNVTFSVADPGSGYTVEWSTDGVTNNDGTGLSKTKAVTVGSPITEYVRLSDNSTAGACKSAFVSATGTAIALPAAPTGLSNQSRCDNGNVTFSVTNPGVGFTVEWSTDGINNNDGTGLSVTKAVTVGSPITEYARLSDNGTGCKSAFVSATGTANTFSVTENIVNQNFGTGTTLPSGWVATGSTTWTNSTLASSSGDYTGASGGSNALADNAASMDASLETSVIDFSGATDGILTFGMRRSSTSFVRSVAVEASTDNGASFTAFSQIFTASAISSGTYRLETVNLGSAINNAAQVKIRFRIVGSAGSAGPNVRIDDVKLTGIKSGQATITADGPTSFCTPGSVKLTSSSAPSYLWSNNATTQTITVGTSGNYTVEVKDANGCASTADPVTVTAVQSPGSFTVTGGGSYCSGGAGVDVSLNGSEEGVSYQLLLNGSLAIGDPVSGTGLGGAAFSFGNQTTAGTYTVTATQGTCSTTMAGSAVVSINVAPAITCPADFTVNTTAGSCSAAVSFTGIRAASATGTPAPAITYTPASGSTFAIGNTTVTATATNVCAPAAECTFVVTVNDAQAPTALCKNITVYLDGDGAATIEGADVNNGSSDNCGTVSLDVSPNTFGCSDIKSAVSIYSAWINEIHYDNAGTDAGEFIEIAGNEGTDLTNWSIVLYNGSNNLSYSTVTLSGILSNQSNGFGTHVVSYPVDGIQNGSPDALALVDNNGTVVQFLSYEGTLTAADGPASGMTSVDIGVAESSSTPIGQSLQLSGTGSSYGDFVWAVQSAQTAGNINNAQTFVSLDANQVILTVSDLNSNSSTCFASVTVKDTLPPTIECPADRSVNTASGRCLAIVTVESPLSDDNCAVINIENDFNHTTNASGFYYVGETVVTWTVEDSSGNTTTCTHKITVTDLQNPNALCHDTTVILDGISGTVSIKEADINNGSNDACGIASVSLDIKDFACSNIGSNTVELTVIDIHGNTDSCTATVTVNDNTAPVAKCQDVTVYLDVDGEGTITAEQADNGSSDICGIALSLSQERFVCAEAAANPEILYVTDPSGNQSSCSFTVTVLDTIKPVAICQDITVYLNATGNGSTSAEAVNNGSTDACGIFSKILDRTSFTCSNVNGVLSNIDINGLVTNIDTLNYVTLTVEDNNGNKNYCTAYVTVVDSVAPIAICQNITVQLDTAGNGITSALAVNNNSYDACGLLPYCGTGGTSSCLSGLSLDINTFDCNNIGPNIVTLTATDKSGNSTSCPATVTVEDNIAPVAICQDVTVKLDHDGNGSITPEMVDNGSNDACPIVSLALNVSDFDCNNYGANNVVLTVTDTSGNTSTCPATVTVVDTVAADAVCKDAVVTLLGGAASITTADVDGGSDDACGIDVMSVSPDAWTCSDIGSHTVTLTVTDIHGNVSSCDATVDVQGTIPTVSISKSLLPVLCQGREVILTATPSEPVSYVWTPGGATSADIDVTATGTYSVVVTNVNGCTGSSSYYVNYNASDLTSAYTIIAFDFVDLHRNTVLNGGVGVTSPTGEAEVEQNSVITAATTFVKAAKITIKSGAVVTNQIVATPVIPLPPYVGNPYAGVLDVNVPANAIVNLTDSIYKNIMIGKNATVTFTRPVIYAQDVKVKDGARVKFTGCAIMSINKRIDFDKNTKFNLEQNNVTLYVGDEDKNDAKKVVEFDGGCIFYGRVYAVRGEIKSHHGSSSSLVQLNGQFIGRIVKGDQYTTWNWSMTCDPACSPAPAPECACVGGIKKLTVEYSLWDATSADPATLRFYSDAALTNNFATFTNVEAGNLYNVSATSLPGGVFGSSLYARTDQNPDSVIVIPTGCGSDIMGGFFRELYVYSQTDASGAVCSAANACGPGRTLMCHTPKNNKTPHTHCVKNKDVEKKLKYRGEWSIGPCVTASARLAQPVDNGDELRVENVVLEAAPNPFKQSTTISFSVPKDDHVKLVVFSLTGQEISKLFEGNVEAGQINRYEFQAGNYASGMYFYRLETGDGQVHVKKLILSE